MHPEDCAVVDGVPVTSLARTTCDIGRTSTLDACVTTLDPALRRGLPVTELAAMVERCRRWPGGSRLTAAVAASDPRAETPIESLTRLRYREFGLLPPLTQAEVLDPDGEQIGRVDFLWWEQGVIGEADGLEKYDAPDALRWEKARELTFTSLGFEVLRNVWDEALPGRPAEPFRRRAQAVFARAAGSTRARGVSYRVPSLDGLRALDRHRGRP